MSNRIDRVVITGASSGIGLDLARRFLAEGSRLIVNGRDPEKLDRARRSLEGGARVVAVPGHVGDRATARAVAAAAQEHLGGVDVLINNAGIFGVKPFLESTEEDLERFFTTNLKGTFLMTQAVVPLMIEGGGGSILNVGTVLVQQAMTGMPASAAMASKGGVHALTVSLAAELARHNIRVNTLAPGIIRTPLIGEGADSMASIHPLRRIGEVRDTTDAALFLARAGFVTGTTLDVDGGYSHGR
ncbi:3-oxoacyl-ACP reductase [Sorangium cellulosum]|uniref:3-oxoacyl-ACP reductase n=1 Tax=Sorangium cellulosum TaxID=56 RepID=A0A4P2QCQ6_SORCE|nr:SDR family oxidoreductase [Sorangium cellulosum]AUX27537.1 3-oxoacyl-ACP reductase [Sorangium cellulosum]